jgi:hypothetical protein
MDWPNSLVKELAARRCVLFLGSGASAGCSSTVGPASKPPTWEAFLDDLHQLLPSFAAKRAVKTLLKNKQYLDAAEIIRRRLSPADFTQYVRDKLVVPRFEKSKIHEAVLKLDPKVVITTNYDQIYDEYCRSGSAVDGYNICKYYDDNLVSELRSPVRLIVKAHGCVSDASKIVLSRSDYFTIRQKSVGFFKVLDSLFLTHTLVFIGYSVSDPDIQIVLENANIGVQSSHPHYAVMQRGGVNSEIKEAFQQAYNIRFIEFSRGRYDLLESGLDDLVVQVLEYRAEQAGQM